MIPAERMKKRKEHIIPLTKQALALLDAITPATGHSEFIFPSDINPRKYTNSSTANVALKRMGFKASLTAHGMRVLASTSLNDHGFEVDLIEVVLAHVDKNAVRSAYNRAQYIKRRKVMMDVSKLNKLLLVILVLLESLKKVQFNLMRRDFN